MAGVPRSFFAFTATRPVAITMVVLAAVVFGFVGLRRLPVNLLPDITYPTVTVRTEYEGASPEDVEERISERLQESVAVVPGVRRVLSISRTGVSDIILEFAWGTRMLFAISDIRERIDRVQLPAEAEKPLVLRYDPSLDPVLTIGMRPVGPEGPNLIELRRIAEDEFEQELSKVEGVAAVKIRGGDEEEIRIVVDERALGVRGIDVALLGQRLAEENVNTASGSIDEGNTEFLVRTLGEFQNLDEIEDIILERRGDVPIRLREVARVERRPRERDVISRVDGSPCVLVDIYREAGANIVELARNVNTKAFGDESMRAYAEAVRENPMLAPAEVRADAQELDAIDAQLAAMDEGTRAMVRRQRSLAVGEHRRQLDFLAEQMLAYGVGLELLQDQSRFIENSIDDVLSSAIKGGFFAILVIFLFLRRASATVILALSIPISLAASFAPMFLSDITLNIMSLGGLALGVGMLVDNSIVVLESISRGQERGEGPAAAAVGGVSKVASAVTASTLTTIAVFFPIVFVEGVAGQLFRDQSLTVVYSLLMSLLVALFVIPMLASRGAEPAAPAPVPAGRISRFGQGVAAMTLRGIFGLGLLLGRGVLLLLSPVTWSFDRAYAALDRVYPPLLAGALRARWIVLAGALVLLGAAGSRLPSLGSELIPEVDQGELYVDVFLTRDATVERTDAVVAPLEAEIAALPEVTRTFLAVGVDPEELNSSEQGEHSARILVELRPLAIDEDTLRSRIRSMIRSRPEIVNYRFSRPSVLSFDAPLVVEVVGKDLLALRETSRTVEQMLAEIPGLRDVRSTLQRGNPEIVLRLDRDKMSALGIDSGVVADILQTKVMGEVATRFAEYDRKIDMRVAIAREEMDRVTRLLEVNVNPEGNPAIPLKSIADVERLEGPSEIRRIGNVRGAEVQATVTGFDIGSSQLAVAAALQDLQTPPGIDLRIGGQKEEMERSMDSIFMALALAVFLVYVVMASQFESLVQPMIILMTLPLAFVGVIFALDWTDTPISVIALLGGIVLAGIVVNNAIIMVDAINQRRDAGMEFFAAIREGASTRLRPVLMTTATTVLGLLPLTGWLGELPLLGGDTRGLELRAPMAITVIAGLTTSTALTLIVIPLVYSVMSRRSAREQAA